MRTRVKMTDLRSVSKEARRDAEKPRGAEKNFSAISRPSAPRRDPLDRDPAAELMLIGSTVEEAIDRAEKFLDDALLSDTRRLRVVHGHGTGKLREALRAFFKEHPLVASVVPAADNEGGQGATIVELKD